MYPGSKFTASALPMFVDVIKTAVAAVLNDGGFRLASVPVTTTTALNTATQLVDWMSQSNNREELDVFAVKVMTHLRNCLPRRIATFRKARREVMWRSYYKLRTSPSFQSLWKEFVFKSVSVDAHPIFYQYVTDQAFQAVMEETFNSTNGQVATVEPLTYGEENALRYVAGYVCHKLRKKITASKHPMRDKLLLCLMDLCDEDDDVSSSADWVHAVDRGGLVHVSESTYSLFERMELIIHSVYNIGTVRAMTEGVKKELHETIITDEDVALHWSILTIEVEAAEGKFSLG